MTVPGQQSLPSQRSDVANPSPAPIAAPMIAPFLLQQCRVGAGPSGIAGWTDREKSVVNRAA